MRISAGLDVEPHRRSRAKAGLAIGLKWNEMPASWVRTDKETPPFQKCVGEQS
jgi:hypothetical protein